MDNKLEMLPLQSGELYLQTTWENGYEIIITRSIRLNAGIKKKDLPCGLKKGGLGWEGNDLLSKDS